MRILESGPAHFVLFVTLATALAVACNGRKEVRAARADVTTSDSTAVAPAPANTAATPPMPAGSSDASSLAPDDIDRWQRGMDAELRAIQDAGSQLRNAGTATDSMNAIFAANETSTRSIGAKAAGVSEQQYQLISSTLSSLAADMAPLEQEMDVSSMPAATIATMRQARDKALATASVGVPPQVLAALRPRAGALRKQALDLAAARLKAAGMAG
jgi:hypothetical protein